MSKSTKRVAVAMLEAAYRQAGYPNLAEQIADGQLGPVPISVAMKAIDLALDSVAASQRQPHRIAITLAQPGVWCDQCDHRVSQEKADFCRNKFCGARP